MNTWDPGFLDKLYASPDAAGVASELVLAVLNTNVHVYTVSPALTIIEKHTSQALANLFGLGGSNAGGVTMPGGAASNTTSMLIARNYMFPETKTEGNLCMADRPLVAFASADSHYSISTAAVQLGLGSKNVVSVRTQSDGSMDPQALRDEVTAALQSGKTPFYVCATAGTTVYGAFDPLGSIAQVCKEFHLWMHIDACWGGPAIFSPTHKHRLDGSGSADSIAFNPHKMLGVPIVCSFLLGADMRRFYAANKLRADYLFHGTEPSEGLEKKSQPRNGIASPSSNGPSSQLSPEDEVLFSQPSWSQVTDLATYTPQCGRKADSLKLYLSWQYHGTAGFAASVDAAFAAAQRLADMLARDPRVVLLNGKPPPCCQVCFRYVGRAAASPLASEIGPSVKNLNSATTRAIVAALVGRGWMVDYSASRNGDAHDLGEYLRVVCNRNTSAEVVDMLVHDVLAVGEQVLGR